MKPDQFHELIVLAPFLTNADEFAHQLFLERGIDVGPVSWVGDKSQHLCLGIPLATLKMQSSKSEIRKFLLGVGASYHSWDYASISALKIDPKRFFGPAYQAVLKEIEASQTRRCWIAEFFGIAP
jgi:hypothetical protein